MIRKAETRDTSRIMDLLSQVLTVHHKGRPDLFKGGVTKYTEEELQSAMDSLLIRKLLTLPAEDLDFLNRDIPDDVWKSITQSLF